MNKQRDDSRDNNPRRSVVILGIFLGIYIISLFVPFVSGYTQFPLYAVKCMGLPIEATSFAVSYKYTVPGTAAYENDILSDRYFCTEAEAQGRALGSMTFLKISLERDAKEPKNNLA